jgi:hypothetical protein
MLNAPMIITRRCPDLVLSYSNTLSQFVVAAPPSFPATNPVWLVVAPSGGDVGPFNNTVFAGMNLQFSLDTLGQYEDIQSMFTEYQVRKLTITVQSLTSDDAGVGSANDNPAIPEIMSAYDPNNKGPLADPIIAIESYANVKRTFLTVRNKHVVSCRPRPSFDLAFGTGTAFNDNVLDFWYTTGAASAGPNNFPVFFGIQMVLRNFPQYYGTPVAPIDPSTMLRFSCAAEIAVRRPH